MGKQREPRRLPIVVVEWIDSATGGGWQGIDQAEHGALECITVGFLVKETDEALSVAHSVSQQDGEDSGVCDMISIPQCAIRRWYLVDGVRADD